MSSIRLVKQSPEDAGTPAINKTQIGVNGQGQVYAKQSDGAVTVLGDAADVAAVQQQLDAHEADTENPHNVTKAQVGLGNVDNTADSAKPVSGPQASAISATVAALLDRGNATNDGSAPTIVTIPAGTRVYTLDLVFTGAAGARTVILDLADRQAGDRLTLDYALPATAGLVIELRNATAGGTILDTLTTDASGDPACIELTYAGSAWDADSALYPSN